MKNPAQTPEKKDPFQQHVSGPSEQYVYDPSQQQYVHDPSQQQQVYDYSQQYLYDSSQQYVHYPSQNNLLDPLQQPPAPAYTAETPQPPLGQGYNNYLGPYPSGPGAYTVTDKPSQGFDGIQQGQRPTQATKAGAAAAAIRRGSRGLFTNPGKWSLKKKLIVAACIVVILVLVIAVPAGVLLSRKRRCKCPGWYDRKSNYYSAYFYPCDSKGKDLNLNKMPSCNWESAGFY